MLLAATRPQDPAFGKQGVGEVGTAPHAMGCTRLLGLPRFVALRPTLAAAGPGQAGIEAASRSTAWVSMTVDDRST